MVDESISEVEAASLLVVATAFCEYKSTSRSPVCGRRSVRIVVASHVVLV